MKSELKNKEKTKEHSSLAGDQKLARGGNNGYRYENLPDHMTSYDFSITRHV